MGGLHEIAIAAAATLGGGLAAGSYHLGLRTIRDQISGAPTPSTSDDRGSRGPHQPHLAELAGSLGAGAAALSIWRVTAWHLWPALIVLFGVGGALVALDLGYRRIPRRVTTPAYVLVTALLTLTSALAGAWSPLARAGATGAALLVVFTVIALISGELGGGDILLAGLIGLVLGWLDPRRAVAAIFLGFVVAALVAGVRIALHATRRTGAKVEEMDRHTRIPLAPYLLLGSLLALCVSR